MTCAAIWGCAALTATPEGNSLSLMGTALTERELNAAGIHPGRLSILNGDDVRRGGRFVLYWMQASQRESCNHALETAALIANKSGLPLLALFCLTDNYPGANLRHYTFMAEGLLETKRRLAKRGVRLEIFRGSPSDVAPRIAKDASALVTDAGHTRIQRKWRSAVAASCGCAMTEVETNLVVPVDSVSQKEEYAARTIRPKLHRLIPEFLRSPIRQRLKKDSLDMKSGGIKCESIDDILSGLKIDRSVKASQFFNGGEAEAGRRLNEFTERKLIHYDELRNDPCEDATSSLSPYLHFGQISPVEIALAASAKDAKKAEPFLEELIVRRELAFNFVRHNQNYDNFKCLPEWAAKVLHEHMKDRREALYSETELEAGKSSDPAWNAAQMEMVKTGRMHGYMRMYWGKRILEWTRTPEDAYGIAIRLNDKYEIDGRDPNGYAGVAWCFGKHDRPWTPGPIFGTVRRMTQSGLRRKFDLDAYISKIEALRS